MAKKNYPEWSKLRKFFEAGELLANVEANRSNPDRLKLLVGEAFEQNEFWFVLRVSDTLKKFLTQSEYSSDILPYELQSMFKMSQLHALRERLNSPEVRQSSHPAIEKLRLTLFRSEEMALTNSEILTNPEKDAGLVIHDAGLLSVSKVCLFDAASDPGNATKTSYSVFDFDRSRVFGVEIVLEKSPGFQDPGRPLNAFLAWYSEDTLLAQVAMDLDISSDVNRFSLLELCDTSGVSLWVKGAAKIEFFTEQKKLFTYSFELSDHFEAANKVPESKNLNAQDSDSDGIEVELESLNKLTGLSGIKKSVKDLAGYLEFLRDRKEKGLETKEGVAINAVFMGNPGTGKTTVARLMGRIYKKLGLLTNGEVIEVDRSSLVGQYVGETAKITDAVIEKSIGNVLFIDEAYTLVKAGVSNDFGQEAIDTLLKRMEDRRGEFFVIVAGYPANMTEFMNSNPGLRSRFNHEFMFEDYSPEELMEIFRSFAATEEYKISETAEKTLITEFTGIYRKRDSSFGNAREVRKIFEEVKLELGRSYAQLSSRERTMEKLSQIEHDHIAAIFKGRQPDIKDDKSWLLKSRADNNLDKYLKELDALTGLQGVKEKIDDLVKGLRISKLRAERGMTVINKPLHCVFSGNPGTGKTTVARLLSNIFRELGLLSKGHLIEVDRAKLVAGYVGQTAIKTGKVIEEAKGGTLFIDEAYTLTKQANDFGQEAVEVLLKKMEDNSSDLIVIVAGYSREMGLFLETNPGLTSRFTNNIVFEDYTPDELLVIAERLMSANGYVADSSGTEKLKLTLESVFSTRDKNFGNARTVRNIVFNAISRQEKRLANLAMPNDDELRTLTGEDFLE